MYPLRSLNVPLEVHVPQFGNPCAIVFLLYSRISPWLPLYVLSKVIIVGKQHDPIQEFIAKCFFQGT